MGCDAPVPTEQTSETPSATATTQPTAKECPMMKAQMEKLAAAIAAVDAATAALNGGDAKAALAELAKAKEALQAMKTNCEKCMKAMADGKGCPMMAGGACPMAGAKAPAADAGVVNVKCPIMGGAINPAKVPDNLTRTYKGQKVGFCCAGCPDAWDKLSDEQKDAKLAKSLPEKK